MADAEEQHGKRVCITGASGFIASHIVQQCLDKGWIVHGTVRDLNAEAKTKHLLELNGASERLTLFQSDLTAADSFEKAFKGCDAVIHTATPVILGAKDGETSVYKPAIDGTQAVLDTIDKLDTIKTLVLTSSMSAMAPKPEPQVKSEEHWSDPAKQKDKGSWYGAAKTDQESMCHKWAEKKSDVRFVAICPTFVIGPILGPKINATMVYFKNFCGGGKAKNDSMSFIDVRDCAAMHVVGLENAETKGRYMCLIESWHWNKIYSTLKELRPDIEIELFGEECVKATQFDRTRQDSLGINIRDIPTAFQESINFLKSRGELE